MNTNEQREALIRNKESFEHFIVNEKGWSIQANYTNDGELISYVRDDVQDCWIAWQAALAHSQQTTDMALLEKIQALPRYSFLLNSSGGVTKYADKSGTWIERYEVVKLIDKR